MDRAPVNGQDILLGDGLWGAVAIKYNKSL